MTGEARGAEFVLFGVCGFSNEFTENPQSFKNRIAGAYLETMHSAAVTHRPQLQQHGRVAVQF